MTHYLLSRKQIDLAVLEWEKLQGRGQNQESLPMFIRNQQALWMADGLLADGINNESLTLLRRKLRQELDLDN